MCALWLDSYMSHFHFISKVVSTIPVSLFVGRNFSKSQCTGPKAHAGLYSPSWSVFLFVSSWPSVHLSRHVCSPRARRRLLFAKKNGISVCTKSRSAKSKASALSLSPPLHLVKDEQHNGNLSDTLVVLMSPRKKLHVLSDLSPPSFSLFRSLDSSDDLHPVT